MNKNDESKQKTEETEESNKKENFSKQEVIDALYDLYLAAKEHQRKTNMTSRQ